MWNWYENEILRSLKIFFFIIPFMKKLIKYDYLFHFRSGTVILIIMVASLGSVPHIWGSTLLTVTLSRLKITQQFVGVVTSLSLIASTVFTIILTRLADIYFGHKLKKLILSLMPFHTIAMIALCVLILLGSPETNYQCKYKIRCFWIHLFNVIVVVWTFSPISSLNQPFWSWQAAPSGSCHAFIKKALNRHFEMSMYIAVI